MFPLVKILTGTPFLTQSLLMMMVKAALFKIISLQVVRSSDRFKVWPCIFPETGKIQTLLTVGIGGRIGMLMTGIPKTLSFCPNEKS